VALQDTTVTEQQLAQNNTEWVEPMLNNFNSMDNKKINKEQQATFSPHRFTKMVKLPPKKEVITNKHKII